MTNDQKWMNLVGEAPLGPRARDFSFRLLRLAEELVDRVNNCFIPVSSMSVSTFWIDVPLEANGAWG